MLSENTKVMLQDLKGKQDVGMEVCFSDSPDLQDTVRVTMGSETAIIKISELYGFMFVIANAEQQEQLMPVKQTTVRKIRKRHIVEVTKDIRKGQKLNVRCETNVPVEVWEGMRGMLGRKEVKRQTSVSLPIITVK